MRHLRTQAVCRVLAVLALIAAGLWSPSLATASTTAPDLGAVQGLHHPAAPAPQSYAGPCTDDLGVTVVVDFQQLGGSTVVRCAPGNGGPFQGTGLDAFQAAGLNIAGTSQHGLSVVCRVNGRPAADEELPIPGDDAYTEQCQQMPPAAAFWSYWQADNNGSWVFSQLGVTSSTARAGGFEALSFSLNSTSAPPRTAPSRPSPEPPPTQDPTPPPSPSPDPTPSDPSPEPPPSNNPPPSPAPTDPPSQTPTPDPTPGPTPGDPSPDDPSAGDAAPSPDPTGESSTESSTTEQTSPGEESATETSSPTTSGDDAEQTSAPAADDERATSAGPDTDDPTSGIASEAITTDPGEDGGGATTLWVTLGILLLLGALAFFVSRRRQNPEITHQVEP